MRTPSHSYAAIAAIYSVVYAAAMAGDHLTTLAVTARGGVETNFLLSTPDGALHDSRALIAYLLLWPVLLVAIWVGRARAINGRDAVRLPALDMVWGAGAAGPLLLPVATIVIKAIATLHNVLVLAGAPSGPRLARGLLTPLGMADPKLVYLVTAGAMLAIAVLIASPIRKVWVERLAATRA